MSYKILEQNGVENEVVDGGALNNFCAGNRDGIIAGVLSECALSAAGNGVAISPGLLIICGVRIKITASETFYVSSVPLRATRYQIIAQVTLGADGNTSAEFFLQSNASLKRDAIYAQGYGTYQAEIGSFTHNPDGSISDMVRTLDVLYGGGNGGANIEVGNVVTQTLPAGQDAEFDMTARNENGKTIFDVKALIPRGASGTDEEAVHFTPQTLTEAQKTQARKNIGALDEAEADIQHIAVDCDHEYEITGYTGHEWNVAVPDHCQLTVTRIKGQTRRKSLNLANNALFEINDNTMNNSAHPIQLGAGDYSISISGATFSTGQWQIILNDIVVFTFDLVTNLQAPFSVSTPSSFRIYANNGSTNAKIMLVSGAYTAKKMPAYQPFDDTLVNSKVQKVLSTGKNLWDGELYQGGWHYEVDGSLALGAGNSRVSSASLWECEPNKVYSIFLLTESLKNLFIAVDSYDINYKTISSTGYYPANTLKSFNTLGNAKYITFTVKNGNAGTDDVFINEIKNVIISNVVDDTFNADIEITGLGEIDNINKTLTDYGSTDVITLDGSERNFFEKLDYLSPYGSACFVAYGVDESDAPANNNIAGYCIGNLGSNGYSVNELIMYNIVGIAMGLDRSIVVNFGRDMTLEEANQYLQSNPIQFIYRLATPRIQTTVDIPAGYSAHKGGLQQQVIEGDYLPYIITKDYPVSGAAQILKNLEIDRDQGKMLDAIQQGALPVGKLANAITIISGDTKKTFDGSTPVEITASGGQGPEGPPGEQGVPGEAATITIRNVDVGTALPGQPAAVVIKNVGTDTNAILDFGFMIPQGKQGEQGKRGEQGVPGNSSLMTVAIMNPVIGGSSYYGRILLTCPVPSTGIPNNGFENLKLALKFTDYQVSGIISLDQSTLNAKRVYGLRKLASNGNKLYALIDSQTISAVVDGEELTGASAVVFAQL